MKTPVLLLWLLVLFASPEECLVSIRTAEALLGLFESTKSVTGLVRNALRHDRFPFASKAWLWSTVLRMMQAKGLDPPPSAAPLPLSFPTPAVMKPRGHHGAQHKRRNMNNSFHWTTRPSFPLYTTTARTIVILTTTRPYWKRRQVDHAMLGTARPKAATDSMGYMIVRDTTDNLARKLKYKINILASQIEQEIGELRTLNKSGADRNKALQEAQASLQDLRDKEEVLDYVMGLYQVYEHKHGHDELIMAEIQEELKDLMAFLQSLKRRRDEGYCIGKQMLDMTQRLQDLQNAKHKVAYHFSTSKCRNKRSYSEHAGNNHGFSSRETGIYPDESCVEREKRFFETIRNINSQILTMEEDLAFLKNQEQDLLTMEEMHLIDRLGFKKRSSGRKGWRALKRIARRFKCDFGVTAGGGNDTLSSIIHETPVNELRRTYLQKRESDGNSLKKKPQNSFHQQHHLTVRSPVCRRWVAEHEGHPIPAAQCVKIVDELRRRKEERKMQQGQDLNNFSMMLNKKYKHFIRQREDRRGDKHRRDKSAVLHAFLSLKSNSIIENLQGLRRERRHGNNRKKAMKCTREKGESAVRRTLALLAEIVT